MPNAEDDPNRDLVEKTKSQYVTFLKTELETGLTFAHVALQNLASGENAHAAEDVHNGRTAYKTVLKYLHSTEMGESDRKWIDEKLRELRAAIDLAESHGAI